EIIDGYRNAQTLQLLKSLNDVIAFFYGYTFCDFQLQIFGIEAGTLQDLGSRPERSKIWATVCTKRGFLNCPTDKLTDIRTGGKPISCHFLFCMQAVSSTQKPIAW